MKRFLTIYLIAAGLLTYSPNAVPAQMPEGIKHIVWLSCTSINDGKEVNYEFAVDIEKRIVLQFEKRNMYYEMQDVTSQKMLSCFPITLRAVSHLHRVKSFYKC